MHRTGGTRHGRGTHTLTHTHARRVRNPSSCLCCKKRKKRVLLSERRPAAPHRTGRLLHDHFQAWRWSTSSWCYLASPASARPAWCAPIMHAADAAQCRHTPPSLARVAPRRHAASASGREELPFASPLPYAFTGPPQVYRYLYNTFGETISVRAPAQNAPHSDWQPHRPCRRQRSSDHRRVLCDEED